jgi:riboflavin kinase, archaea type
MQIEGNIISGMGKGTYFMSQEFYIEQFQEKLHFKPFGGTLNIKIKEESIDLVKKIPVDKFDLVLGQGKFGDVKFIKATLNNKVEGALVFPGKTEHTEDVLEFISNKNLRKHLDLKDGDLVDVKID